jgi:glutamyl-tRNA synthetase
MIQRDSEAGFYIGRCVDKALAFDTADCNWRLRTNDADAITMYTLQGEISEMLPPDVAFFAARKKDSFPAYQLCSVVDDLHYNVDFVVRGEDLRASTLAQLFLAQQMGAAAFLQTNFYHHPLLMENGGQKLSKSNGSTSIQYLRKSGISPEEIFWMIGVLAGITQPVHSWETLGNALLPF